jgi:hypothetical protein
MRTTATIADTITHMITPMHMRTMTMVMTTIMAVCRTNHLGL